MRSVLSLQFGVIKSRRVKSRKGKTNFIDNLLTRGALHAPFLICGCACSCGRHDRFFLLHKCPPLNETIQTAVMIWLNAFRGVAGRFHRNLWKRSKNAVKTKETAVELLIFSLSRNLRNLATPLSQSAKRHCCPKAKVTLLRNLLLQPRNTAVTKWYATPLSLFTYSEIRRSEK